MSDDPAQSGGQFDDQAGSLDGATSTAGSTVLGGGKEQEAVMVVEPQALEAIETKEPDEIPEEVVAWMERVERGEDVNLPQSVVHDDVVIVAPTQPNQVKIVLPLSQEAVERGLHLKLFDSLRWLAEWCVRLIKKFPGKVFYRSTEQIGR